MVPLMGGRVVWMYVVLGVLDGGQVGRWEVGRSAWLMAHVVDRLGCSMEVVRWLLGGCSIEVGWVKWRSAVDGGVVHAVQMDLLIDRLAVGG